MELFSLFLRLLHFATRAESLAEAGATGGAEAGTGFLVKQGADVAGDG